MAKSRVKVERFDKINRSRLTLSNVSKRTRTGALKTKNRRPNHTRTYKH